MILMMYYGLKSNWRHSKWNKWRRLDNRDVIKIETPFYGIGKCPRPGWRWDPSLRGQLGLQSSCPQAWKKFLFPPFYQYNDKWKTFLIEVSQKGLWVKCNCVRITNLVRTWIGIGPLSENERATRVFDIPLLQIRLWSTDYGQDYWQWSIETKGGLPELVWFGFKLF